MWARIVLWGLCLSVFFALPGVAAAQAAQPALDPALEADIVRLMEMTGTAASAEQLANTMVAQMLDAMRRMQPNIPDRVVEIAKEVTSSSFASALRGPNGLMMQMVPLYAKYLTRADVTALLEFYQSDVGRKAIAVMATVMQEGAKVGDEWARKVTPGIQAEIEKRLRAEGFIK